MKSHRNLWPIYFVSLLLLLIACSSGSSKNGNGRNTVIPAIEAVQAQYGSLPLTERLSGVVKAKNQVEIFPEITAVVQQVKVQNGDDVRKGQPLVTLRDTEFQERLNQAKAAYQIAVAQSNQSEAKLKEIESTLKRTKSLKDQNLASDAEMETIETQALSARADVELAHARVEQAKATVAEREASLAQTVIRAPVDGTVGNRNAEVGMIVSPGTRLFTLGQLDSVKVEVVLTDRMLNYIETGQRAELSSATIPSGVISSAVSRISPFLHPVTHSTDAEIDVANPDHYLKSGMFITVDIYYGESEQATLVPLSALYENPLSGATGVYVCRDTLNRLPVEPMSESSETSPLTDPLPFEFVPTEVIASGRMTAGIRGIDPGSWVVTIGQDLLGGEPGDARVRPVKWTWVDYLQNLKREDLLQGVMQQQQAGKDTAETGI